MASTEFGTNHALTVKRWSNTLAREVLGDLLWGKFAGKSSNSIIQIHSDLEKGAGDEIRYDLRVQTRSSGVQGDTELKGFETPLTFYQDSFKIDQLRNAHEFRRMSQQRTNHDLRTESKDSLKTWWGWVLEGMMLSYLAGTPGDDVESVTGITGASAGFAGNAFRAPDNAHKLEKGATMGLEFIDTLVEMAKTINPKIRPTRINGSDHYVLVLHPYSVTSLLLDTSGINWMNIQQNASQRSSTGNPIFTRALGMYKNVILIESEFIPRDTTNDYCYNLFLGAQAGVFALGNAYDLGDRAGMGGGSYFNWVEERDDYRNKKGVGAAAVFGMQKSTWNGADFGCIQMRTTDPAHT